MPVLLDIDKFQQLYRRTLRAAGVTDEAVYIKLDRIRSGKIRVLTHVTVENQTNAFTKCRLGIDHSGLIHYLDELQTIAADELAVSRSDIPLGEGDRFFAELTGTTTGDVLVMTCVGWEQSL
ncbi:unnamed protein product [marine sediment metagenome]|uniref:Uncharacterized protein n=1 Tax=marine sediment metagenome TaxID=412755 RepID=X1C2E9_9ZZZZ